MLKNNKNIIKLMVFTALFNGCVLPETKTIRENKTEINSNGKKEKIQITYGRSGYEYTFLGNIWNSATYGVICAGYGAIEGWDHGFNTTNDNSVTTKVIDGTINAFSDSAYYAKEGMIYGYNMTYDKGLSIERMLKNKIDNTIPKLIPFYNEYGR